MDWLSAWLSGPLIPFRRTAPNRPNVVSFRIPAAPPVSSCTQPPTSPHPFVSSCIRWVPRMRDTAVTSTGPATEPHPPAFGTVGEGRHGLEPRASRLTALSAVLRGRLNAYRRVLWCGRRDSCLTTAPDRAALR